MTALGRLAAFLLQESALRPDLSEVEGYWQEVLDDPLRNSAGNAESSEALMHRSSPNVAPNPA